MEQNIRQRNTGFFAFFISGLCAISSGIVVSMLQERLGFAYGMTGILLSLMSIGNLVSGFAAGALPGKIGFKKTVIVLTGGYMVGYGIMAFGSWVGILALAFFIVGIGKGSIINFCTVLVGDNSKNRTKGMNIMHSCYACGALLCPFAIALTAFVSPQMPMLFLAILGGALWISLLLVPIEKSGDEKKRETDWSFLKSKRFWLLTGLLFCQNATETSVTGWMVTYYKGSGLLTGMLSTYTVTVMWTATLIARLLIAFVFPIRKPEKAMIVMGVGCTIFYFAMIGAKTPTVAILLLFAFAFSMAGMNPTAVASAGRMTNLTSVGIMFPVASSGAIIMPWVTGVVADIVGLQAGMACILIPCIGMLAFSAIVARQ